MKHLPHYKLAFLLVFFLPLSVFAQKEGKSNNFSDALAIINQFYVDAQAGNYDQTYEALHPKAKESLSIETWTGVVKIPVEQGGKLLSKKVLGKKNVRGSGVLGRGVYVEYIFACTYENVVIYEKFTLFKYNSTDALGFVGYKIDTDKSEITSSF